MGNLAWGKEACKIVNGLLYEFIQYVNSVLAQGTAHPWLNVLCVRAGTKYTFCGTTCSRAVQGFFCWSQHDGVHLDAHPQVSPQSTS